MSMWWSCQGRGDALPCLDYLIADTERHAGERQRGQWLVSLKRHLNRSNDPIYIFGLCLLRSLTLSLSTGPQMIHGRWQKFKVLWCVGTIYHKQFWLFRYWYPLRLSSSSLLGRHRAICHSGLTLYLLPLGNDLSFLAILLAKFLSNAIKSVFHLRNSTTTFRDSWESPNDW